MAQNMPKEEEKENEQKKKDGDQDTIYITQEGDGRLIRIYWFSDDLNFKTHSVHLSIPAISPQLYAMRKVADDNDHLLYLDIRIPWKRLDLPKDGMPMNFHYKTDKGWITTPATQAITSKMRAFYNQHKVSETECAWRIKSETQIMRHLLTQIVDWQSYRRSKIILSHLVITIEGYRGLYKEYLERVKDNKKVNQVFRTMLIKSISPKQLPDLNAMELFQIVQATMQTNTPVFENDDSQQIMGLAIYRSFSADLRRVLNYVPSQLISSADRICLFPCFNFFRYMQDLDKRVEEAKRQQQGGSQHEMDNNYQDRLSDYELKRVDFNKDIEWIEENVVSVLDVDLAIGAYCHRIYPLETIILNFCKTLQKSGKNGCERMIEIFARLSTIDACDAIFECIFNNEYNLKSIFFLLFTDFEAWMQFCYCIGEQFIRKHKRVHCALVENLAMQIDKIKTTKQFHKLLTLLKKFKLLNSLTIRSKIVKNINVTVQIEWKPSKVDQDNCAIGSLLSLLGEKDDGLYDYNSESMPQTNKNSNGLDSLIEESMAWMHDVEAIKDLSFETKQENVNDPNETFRSNFVESVGLIKQQKERYCTSAVKEIKNAFQTKMKAQQKLEWQKKKFEETSGKVENLLEKTKLNLEKINELQAETQKLIEMIPAADKELRDIKNDLILQPKLINQCETLLNNYNKFNSKTKEYSNEIEMKRKQALTHFETNWYDWNTNDILFWFKLKLNCLENSDAKDENNTTIDFDLIEKNVKSQHIKSKYLSVMNRNDLKSLGFELFEHRCILHESIQQLIETYPIPSQNDSNDNDNEIEGFVGVTSNDECNDKEKYDSKYLCPITKQLFKLPVIAYDGITYEKCAIIEYIESNHCVPSQTNKIGKQEIDQAIAMLFPDDQMQQEITKLKK